MTHRRKDNPRRATTKRAVSKRKPAPVRIDIHIADPHGSEVERENFLNAVDRFLACVANQHRAVEECDRILRSFVHTKDVTARLLFFVSPRASLDGRCALDFAMSMDSEDQQRAVWLARAALE